MHSFWTGLLGILAFLWIIAAIRMLWGMAIVPRLTAITPLRDAECPTVSILVAARDEAAGLARSLPTLLAQDYPHYEVIVVDDRSSDSTPRILEEFARLHKNLRVIPLTELPPGWLGKSHALATAHAHATGDWLIFTDADVRFAPDLVRRALASAKRKDWDHLTMFFTPDMAGFWEKSVLSFWLFSLILWLEPWKVSDPKSRRYAGSGAFQLLRRSAYEAIGTHRRLALEVVEDLKLGKLVKVGGFRSGMALSDGMVRVRWHEGLHGIIHGLTKNSFAACNYRISTLALNLLLLFTFQILPYLALIIARGMPQALAAVSVLVLLILRLRADHYHEIPRGYALTHPLGAIIFSYILLRSAFVVLSGGGLTWRGTFYALDDLRKGSV
jgi:glycosyltransferase involved in cell wall biosynthesis